jgi:hypothetical protein
MIVHHIHIYEISTNIVRHDGPQFTANGTLWAAGEIITEAEGDVGKQKHHDRVAFIYVVGQVTATSALKRALVTATKFNLTARLTPRISPALVCMIRATMRPKIFHYDMIREPK